MSGNMTAKFAETEDGIAFVASGNGRKTSREIMNEIARFAENIKHAEAMWSQYIAARSASDFDLG